MSEAALTPFTTAGVPTEQFAALLEKGKVRGFLTADDLMGLAPFEMAIRPCVGGQTLAPLTGTTLPLPPTARDGAALADTSRERFGRPRSEVEAALKVRGRAPDTTDAAGSGTPDTAKTFGRRQKKPKAGKGDM